MNGPFPAGAVPVIGRQQAAEQAAMSQLFLNMYLPLIPHLATLRLAHGYHSESGIDEPATPERIAEEAERICNAALGRLGIVRAASK